MCCFIRRNKFFFLLEHKHSLLSPLVGYRVLPLKKKSRLWWCKYTSHSGLAGIKLQAALWFSDIYIESVSYYYTKFIVSPTYNLSHRSPSFLCYYLCLDSLFVSMPPFRFFICHIGYTLFFEYKVSFSFSLCTQRICKQFQEACCFGQGKSIINNENIAHS